MAPLGRTARVTIVVLGAAVGRAEAAVAQDSVSIVPAPRLAAGHGLLGLGGQGWRAAWGTAIRLPVLTAADLGGGFRDGEIQSGTNPGVVGHGRDGYARRLIPIDPGAAALLGSPDRAGGRLPVFLEDVTSTLHPGGPAVAAALYRAAGLPVIERRLVVLPPSGLELPAGAPAPGTAVWIERAPELDGRGYGPFTRVIPTDSLLALQNVDTGAPIDLRAYLSARLVDLLLGDRGRSEASWLWGWDDARSLWIPIARAQTQALLRASRVDRILLGAYLPGVGSFAPSSPPVAALTLQSWDLDRPWLARLDRAAWDSVARALAIRLDEAALQRAVTLLPAALGQVTGAEIVAALRVRRDALPAVVRSYYGLMTRYPDLELTGGADTVVAERRPDGAIDLTVRQGGRTRPLRRFLPAETEEVRLHLGAGADRLELAGVDHSGIGLRVTGGLGSDTVVRHGEGTRRVVLYDDRDGITGIPDDAARLVPHPVGRLRRWADGPPLPPDHGSRRAPAAILSFNGDLGLLAGAGMRWTWFGFDEPHYRQRLAVAGSYAFGAGRGAVSASFERRDLLRNIHLSAAGVASGIDVVRFFGFGNETAYSEETRFYHALTRQYAARLMVGFSRDPSFELRVGPVVAFQSTDTTGSGTLVAVENPYGGGRFDLVGAEATLRYQPNRSPFAPGFGVGFTLGAKYFPAVRDAQGTFGEASADAHVTWTPRLASRVLLAGRLGGSVLGGRVPFAQAARVGGPKTLRGFAVDRFAGDRGSVYGSLELRSRLTRFRLGLIPGDLGFLIFGSGGRVWQSQESSSLLHVAAGGGIWVAPTINWLPDLGDLVGRFEVARSREGTFFYFGTGFRF